MMEMMNISRGKEEAHFQHMNNIMRRRWFSPDELTAIIGEADHMSRRGTSRQRLICLIPVLLSFILAR